MIKIYVLDTESLRKADFSAWVGSLPFGDAEKARLLAIKNETRRWESLGGLVALSRLLDKRLSDAPFSTEIRRAPSGKPYFSSPAAPFFSISHSGGIAAAAAVDCRYGEIGLDVEEINVNYDFSRVAGRCFSEEELSQIAESKNPADAFFSLWTAKEATAKIDGSGLSSLISGKDARLSSPTYVSRLSLEMSGKRVALSVCSYVSDQPIQIFTDSEV